MRGDLVGYAALVYLFRVGKAQMLRRRHVAYKRRTVCRRGGRANRGHYVVVAGGDVGDNRPKHVERRLFADFLLAFHVHLYLVEGNVPRPLYHRLHAALAAALHEFAKDVKLSELRGVGGVCEASRP